MSVTEKLLRVFRVDQQLRGLQGRLGGAERFLEEQTRQLKQVEAKRDAAAAQLRQLRATIADHEGEMARLDAKLAAIREQMNSAKTNKEYKAFLTEINTFKTERDAHEESALGLMGKADELKGQLEELEKQRGEREKVCRVASDDRAKRAEEIRERVNALTAERSALAAEVTPEALRLYTELVTQRGDDAMAPIEEQDRRRHEYNCGSCMMSMPVETVSALLKGGVVTRCVSCGCILFIESEMAKSLQPASSKR